MPWSRIRGRFLLVQVQRSPWRQWADGYEIDIVTVTPVVQGSDVEEDLRESVADGLSPHVRPVAPQGLNILGDIACVHKR